MKTRLLFSIAIFCCISQSLFAQTNYSFSLSSILNAMPNGLRLPNGTIAKVDKVVTGTGVHDAASGTAGSTTNMGGTFTGTTLAAYVGNTTPSNFTIIETGNSNTINNGISNNCQNSIGFRVYFDRPTVKISFLALDIDGNNTNPGNAEWMSSMAFNGDVFVPYTQTVSAGTNLATVSITTNTTWRTLVTNTISATAAANIPTTLSIKRASGGGLNPNDVNGQVLFNPTVPTDAVTNFFGLWGIWQVPAAPTNQTSGLSPIVVRVSPDFGDCPDSYKTLLASGGPSHGVVGTLALGILNETKPDGQPSVLANLDVDDDGVSSVPAIINTNALTQTIANYSLTTTFTNNTNSIANYVAWIDWNNNGTFEPSEAQTATSDAITTTGSVTFTWTNAQLTGASGIGNTYARFRVTTEPITTADVGGAFKDGEVEDYLVPFVVPLSLILSDFKGSLENGYAQLYWKTADEKNTKSFEIEYSSNGSDFTKVDEVAAIGNGNHEYKYSDQHCIHNTNFYRLKMMDIDGSAVYSKIVSLRVSGAKVFTVSIAPNPVENILNVKINSEDPLFAEIYNALGTVVYAEKLQKTDQAFLDCSRLSSGVYFLRLSNIYGDVRTVQFLKK